MKKLIISLTILSILIISIGVASSLEGKNSTQSSNYSKITIQYFNITVVEGDTIWSISERYRGNVEQESFINMIRQINNLNGNVIRVGQTLKIPKL
ncbi:LysM domain-containing protein [Anaerobranca californiensis DSM 14826]|jgi:LysM repeat protein|uniref:LysM domain-containing protein n=1 Tax=Anaerobranca californiensis DSM 14826 TaxID=1120989 RepID=A0A1M6K8X5_9FIRM|nr:LysM peptidoglycan-binding domain-containing protein [Anaerobranca californiensis]SHJ55385.1 LysM domain-containing protein [Anaerobranca californiensis DSM 14826]